MNNHLLGSQRRQSDEIMKKLNQMKNQFNIKYDTSTNNLADYLPNQRTSLQSQNPERQQSKHNLQSYRQSLEKKLQRLFKQQKKVFHDNQSYSNIDNQPLRNFEKFVNHQSRQAFTLQKMQAKIKQLEKKYLSSNPISQERTNYKQKEYKDKQLQYRFKKSKSIKQHRTQEQNANNQKKTKSIYQANRLIKQKSPKKQRIQQKSQKKLLTQIGYLKKQIRQIRQSNLQLNQKIQCKEHERKNKKQRSKFLLGCILAKLIQIQQQVRRRQTNQKVNNKQKTGQLAQSKYSMQQRQRGNLKQQNSYLILQIQQLNRQLKRQMNQRKIIEQRSKLIQNQLIKNYKK